MKTRTSCPMENGEHYASGSPRNVNRPSLVSDARLLPVNIGEIIDSFKLNPLALKALCLPPKLFCKSDARCKMVTITGEEGSNADVIKFEAIYCNLGSKPQGYALITSGGIPKLLIDMQGESGIVVHQSGSSWEQFVMAIKEARQISKDVGPGKVVYIDDRRALPEVLSFDGEVDGLRPSQPSSELQLGSSY